MRKRQNGTLRLIFSQDKLQVFAEINPPEGGGTPVGMKQVKEALIDANIVYGVIDDLEMMRKLRVCERKSARFIIASGRRPARGADATLERLWLNEGRRRADLDAPSIDLRELDAMRGARENEVIARKIPPMEGSEGISVFGKFIPSRPGSDRLFKAGANVEAINDGREFVSRIGGMPKLEGNLLSVSPVLEINGNVDYSVGNIDFSGTVIIRGDVCDGFSVNAEKDVIITGHVDAATVTAGGDIVIKYGVTNRCLGFISAGGSVSTRHIINSIVEAEKDIVVEREIMHSFARSNGAIRCESGRIIGGDIMARNEIIAGQLGAPIETATVVRAGFNFKTYIIIRELEQKLSQIVSVIRDLHLKLIKQSGLSQDETAALKEEMRGLEEKRRCIEAEILSLREASPVNAAASIRCPGTMYGLVYCWIGELGRKVLSPVKAAAMGLDEDGEISDRIVASSESAEAEPEAALEEVEKPETPTAAETDFSVLIADNSRRYREGLKEILESGGVKVAGVAENSAEAISLLQELSPNVIVMDLLLPGADFTAAAEAIRCIDPNVRIVITAGIARMDAIRNAIDSGAFGFILKPFDAKHALRTIHRAASLGCAEQYRADAVNV